MQPYTTKEKAKITAGAVAALVITGRLVVLAIAFMSAHDKKEAANWGGLQSEGGKDECSDQRGNAYCHKG